ncbi:type II restriction endonuclease subunit M [Stenotrophomonas sp.]|uniref:type II restriction endonuclease subunit M n=1 Tax=Stenotrophomonas sp. TaxID=69392 RepID=UPI0028AE7536|nr:type II restriction endonuclease subunit M [Stenotrophomonas sp.]
MTFIIRLLSDEKKESLLSSACKSYRVGEEHDKTFRVDPDTFKKIPSSPFAYWVPLAIAQLFGKFSRFEAGKRSAKQGIATADDFRFIRLWWEIPSKNSSVSSYQKWIPITKGGRFSPFYNDIATLLNWERDGNELKAWASSLYNNSHWTRILKNVDRIGQAGITWPLRGITFSAQAVPAGGAFSVAGKMAFVPAEELLMWLAIFNSKLFDYLIRLFAGKVGGVQYQNGLIADIPVPIPSRVQQSILSELALSIWRAKWTKDSANEISHAFIAPPSVNSKDREFPESVDTPSIQAKIDEVVFELYGLDASARSAMDASEISFASSSEDGDVKVADDAEDEECLFDAELELYSWCIGVAFGRFDWRLATGERAAPPEPEPFDPLPAKSPGMLPDGADPFHAHAGILVDDQGHPHDLARLIEEVLARVDVTVPDEVRRWLQRDFFAFHLQRYSKSRRKAPIYWPLSTPSGSYTLWVYYPSLTSQTLYTAINDFIEPKLQQVGADVTALRNKGSARTRDDEKQFEALQAFELELIELRDTLLGLAPTYKPNHDDGVQISAAPLWPLFRHKPWQKVLKDTWAKMEKGDYDWAHLAMNYWPERVREKCKTDKSLAIAHHLESLYEEPVSAPKNARGRKGKGEAS